MCQIQRWFAAIVCSSIFLGMVLISPMYVYSTSPQPPFDETQESDMISTSIENANAHVKNAMEAIQQNDPTEAMRSLEELQYNLANIKSNVTNLLFTVTAQPP